MKYVTPLLLSTCLIVAATSINAKDDPPTKNPEPNADKIVEDWTFPYGSGGGIQTIGIGDGPIQTSIIETTRSFGEVWAFYAKKIGSGKQYADQKAYYHHGKAKDGRYFIRDFIKAGEPRRTFFVYTCPKHTVTVIAKPVEGGTVVDMTVVAHK